MGFRDQMRHLKRGPQIITPKDAGIISAYIGLSPGYKVVEAGTGSGAFTSYLANLVRPRGKVYGYEKEERFFKLTHENLKKMKLDKRTIEKGTLNLSDDLEKK